MARVRTATKDRSGCPPLRRGPAWALGARCPGQLLLLRFTPTVQQGERHEEQV